MYQAYRRDQDDCIARLEREEAIRDAAFRDWLDAQRRALAALRSALLRRGLDAERVVDIDAFLACLEYNLGPVGTRDQERPRWEHRPLPPVRAPLYDLSAETFVELASELAPEECVHLRILKDK
jgi:hypothetical protein